MRSISLNLGAILKHSSLLSVGGGCRRYPTVENRMRLAKAGGSGGLPSSSSSVSLDVYAPPPPDTLFASLFMAAITSREKIPHTAKDQPLRSCVLFLQPQHPSNAPTPPRLGPLIFLTRKPQACVFLFCFVFISACFSVLTPTFVFCIVAMCKFVQGQETSGPVYFVALPEVDTLLLPLSQTHTQTSAPEHDVYFENNLIKL